jgi:uncharacterized cupredoxin-like copper-binding protein
MNFITRAAIVAALGVTATGLGYVVDAAGASGHTDSALGPGTTTVELNVNHSKFDRTSLTVHSGTLLHIVLHNNDPILHEFVLGGPEVHARHASGTEGRHPPVPGEVTINPGETAETLYVFETPGTFEFVCHLPRHAEFGMRGTITAV